MIMYSYFQQKNNNKITPSIQHSPSWEVNSSWIAVKFLAFYGTRRFITAFTSARHLSLPSARSIQSMPPHSSLWRSILILSPHLHLAPTGRIFMKFYIWEFLEKSVKKIQVSSKSDQNNSGTLYEELFIFFVISRSFLLTVRNISGQKLDRKSKPKFYVQLTPPKIVPSFNKKRTFY